jgi:23S rRNA (guanosine2251-2'-O)-methyltransferase
MHRPPPRRPGPPGSRPPRGGPPQGRGGPPQGRGGPPRDHPEPRAPQPGKPPRPRDAEAGPQPRGRDRRGMNDPRPSRTPEPPPRPAPQEREATPPGALWIHGLHAVAAALANPRRRARRLLLTAEAEAELTKRVPKPWRIQAELADRHRFQTFLPEDAVHQGAALLAEPLTPLALDQAIARSDGPVLLLDQVTDPRNVGAILRSAAAFGAACVVMQDRNAPPETGALARAASGALEVVPIAREVNLSRAIVALQRAGFWVLGLAGGASRTLAEAAPRDRRVALVLGAEDAGLRRLQRETCDELVRLPIAPGIESLNVAAAAAVALYEIARDRPVTAAEPEEETEE